MGDGIVNRLTHSPVNTPCPSYRAHDFDFLDDAIGATDRRNHYSRIGRSWVLCPVEIHVDASLENADGSGALDGSQKNLLDLDTDDENILGNPYVFIGDGQSSDNTPVKFPYPDANSHSNYNLLTEDTQSFDSWSKNIRDSYPAANSHGDTFQDSNSHSKYDVFSDNSDFKNVEIPSSRSIANSHGTYGILTSDSSDKTPAENENYDLSENLIPCEGDSGYEIANSHSNYQIFYNSQTQCETYDAVGRDLGFGRCAKNLRASSPTRSDSSRSSRSTEETSTTCDIEECLVQIEESLMNIEQNLLHVQDLDIPELKNLLYKSPSIERSLFEVQDLLCTENLESVKRGQLFSFDFDEDGENLLDVSPRNLTPDSDHDTFTNDENLLQFSDDRNPDKPGIADGVVVNSIFYGSTDGNVNFIPNSLGRTPTKGDFRGAGENIKASSLQDNADFTYEKARLRSHAADVINDNLNSRIGDKKSADVKKCHSLTNSLDENSIFNKTCGLAVGRRKTSLESLRGGDKNEGEKDFPEMNGKAKSDDTLDNKSSYGEEKRKSSRRSRRKSKENRLAEVEAKTEEFRRKIESIISSRQSIVPNLQDNTQKNTIRQGTGEVCPDTRRNSQERSPRIRRGSGDKEHSPPNAKQFKSNSFEKRKRKKTSRMQSAENAALVPSKLISLSLSLLLAALLQAVRCLTDLVEDAFRSVSYDRNGLLE